MSGVRRVVRKPGALAAADLRGLNQLAIAGIDGVVDLVEAMHHRIAIVPRVLARPAPHRATGVSRLVYRSIHGVVGLVGGGVDGLLAGIAPLIGDGSRWPGRERMVAALNGVLGDHLEATDNPLALPMALRRNGVAVPDGREALAAAIPEASGKVVVLVHGLCMSDVQWLRKGHDHGAALARDRGYTPVYLHYNSGRHISTNGRAFANTLEALMDRWPVPVTDLVLIGHSMGGLVARSAFHYGTLARQAWPQRLDKLVFLGTPHHGAPLERGGSSIDALLGVSAFSAPLARIGKVRSAGITDLRFGNVVDDDWTERDRFARSGDQRNAVPLPRDVACFAIAATTGKSARTLASRLLGDGIVPLDSALGRHADPRLALQFDKRRQWVAHETGHLDLLSDPRVYAQISKWLASSR